MRRLLRIWRPAARFFQKHAFYLSLALCLTLIGGGAYLLRNPKTEKPPAAVPLPAAQSMDERLTSPAPARPKPVADGEILRDYCPDEAIWSETLAQYQVHEGIDFKASPGEAVYTPLPGAVLAAEWDPLWGFCVTLSHEGGILTRYAGLASVNLLSVGDAVEAGQIIGACAGTPPSESAMPSHIHFECFKNGQWYDFPF